MPRVCYFTGKKTTVGRSLRYRGRPKYLVGIGLKVTAITKRTFKPNLQTVTARGRRQAEADQGLHPGDASQGLVVKPLKRKYAYTRQQSQG